MKKKIAFLMASVMSLSMMPTINSYARDIELSKGNISVSEKTQFYEPSISRPGVSSFDTSKIKYLASGNYLNISIDDEVTSKGANTIGINLENAKFNFGADYITLNSGENLYDASKGTWDSKNDVYTRNGSGAYLGYKMTIDSARTATVQLNDSTSSYNMVQIPLVVRMDEDTNGKAKVNVSGLKSDSLVFATVASGSTTTSVDNAQTGKNRIGIDNIIIKENTSGTMNPANGEGFYLELPSDYKFSGAPSLKGVNCSWGSENIGYDGNSRINFTFKNFKPADNNLNAQILISGLSIVPDNDNDDDAISKEDIKINIGNIGGDMVTDQEFTAGTHADYNLTFKTDGTVPTLLNGYYDRNNLTSDKTESVKVVVSEDTANSFINGGDLILTLSDSAKLNAVKISDDENMKNFSTGTYKLGDNKNNVEVKDNRVIIRDINTSSSGNSKARFKVTCYLSLESGFVGDVTMKASGDALRNSASIEPVVIAKSINPLNNTVNTTYFTPGQTVELGDIVLTEQLNSKGYSAFEKDKTVILGFNNNNNYLSIVGTPTIKTEGGLKVKDVKTTSTNSSGSALSFGIDTASSRNKASKITISGIKVAASAATPEGKYDLILGGTTVGGNSTAMIGSNNVASFSTDGVKIANLQYGGKVDMKITIGDKIVKVNGKDVEMKMAPFIDAKTGTTYMQVSDIVKATGKTCTHFDNRIAKLPDMKQTLFVTFGDRTFEKDSSVVKISGQTIPETMTNEQGQTVNMIIKDEYTCLPIRYFVEKVLGQKINWNGTDNTITVE